MNISTCTFTIGALLIVYFIIRTVTVRPGKLRFSLFWIISGCFFMICSVAEMLCHAAFFKALCLFILLFCLAAAAWMILILLFSGREKRKATMVSPDYVVVLGVHYPSEEFSVRVQTALEYHMAHPDCEIICSGGRGSDESISEAEAYSGYLSKNGVPNEKIILEQNSTGTAANFHNSLDLMESEDAVTVIVTSDYHALRARHLAGKCGFRNIVCYSANYRTISWPNYAMREMFALIYAVLRTK